MHAYAVVLRNMAAGSKRRVIVRTCPRSAVIGGEGVRAEGPAQTGGRARGLQNTHIYGEKRIVDVFRRESKSESASWSQSRLGPNLRSRKSRQNPIEITHFDVSEVANTTIF